MKSKFFKCLLVMSLTLLVFSCGKKNDSDSTGSASTFSLSGSGS